MKVAKTDHDDGTATYAFSCPGCGTPHAFNDTWDVSGWPDSPTVSPSLLVTYPPESGIGDRCHSLIRGGRIEFLSDCSHALAGQTVDLPEYEPHKKKEG